MTSAHPRSTILIVDDDPVARAALKALLQYSYALVYADSGYDALQLAASSAPDLVLLDVMLPDLDGYDVCQRLRQDPLLAEVPIIMLTALDNRAARLRGIDAGADDFISKPFDRVELMARVHTITRLNRYRRLITGRAKYEMLVNSSPDGIMLVDSAGRVTLVNPAMLEILQLPAQAVLGERLLSLVAPQHVSLLGQLVRDAAVQPGRKSGEVLFRRTPEDYVPTEIHVAAILVEDPPEVQVIVRDVAERKRAALALEAERRRVAYDLHDGLAQISLSAYYHLQAFAARYRSRSPALQWEMQEALESLQRVVRETRRMIAGLRPTDLDDFGLARALGHQFESLVAQGWEIQFEESLPPQRLSAEIETALFWVTQEAITNIRKHAQSLRVDASLTWQAGMVRLVIRDYGSGFDVRRDRAPHEPGQHLGLASMQERVSVIGGRCTIRSTPGEGTWVVAEVPWRPRASEEAMLAEPPASTSAG